MSYRWVNQELLISAQKLIQLVLKNNNIRPVVQTGNVALLVALQITLHQFTTNLLFSLCIQRTQLTILNF